jgi:outer membrane lipoprotein carrier protein
MQLANHFIPQGLKLNPSYAHRMARLKSCPDALCLSGRIFWQPMMPKSLLKNLISRLTLCFSKANAPRWMMGLVAVFMAAALLSTSLSAQQPSPSAHDLAQRVDRHYNQLHSLKAGFTESYQGLGMRRTESGTMLLVKPGRMKWEYTQPTGKLFLLDGQFAWFYARGDSQVQRIPAKDLDDLRSPLRFLLGRTELEKELNSLALKPAANGQFVLSGQPKGQEKRIRRLSLTVTSDGTITGIEMEESDGALTRFTFTDEHPNVTIPPQTFRFTPPAGVPVVSARPPV